MIVEAGILVAVCVIAQVYGHGMLWDPPNRSSMWRFGFPVPPNYDDNQNFCGGKPVQWEQNGGRCGICGDNVVDPTPRANENGGTYGLGIIGKTYTAGSDINIVVRLTKAHKGDFTFSICNLDAGAERDECFQQVLFSDGSDKYTGVEMDTDYSMSLRLPQGLRCAQCVLRWNYRAGNDYGQCDDGSFATGCGPQETFRSCSDISIV